MFERRKRGKQGKWREKKFKGLGGEEEGGRRGGRRGENKNTYMINIL